MSEKNKKEKKPCVPEPLKMIVAWVLAIFIVGFSVIFFSLFIVDIGYKNLLKGLIYLLDDMCVFPKLHKIITKLVVVFETAILIAYDLAFQAFLFVFGGVVVILLLCIFGLWLSFFYIKYYFPLRHIFSPPIRESILNSFPFCMMKDDEPFGFINILVEFFMGSNPLGKTLHTMLHANGTIVKSAIQSFPGMIYDDNCEIESVRQEADPLENGRCDRGYKKDNETGVCFRNVDMCIVKEQSASDASDRLLDYSKKNEELLAQTKSLIM